MIEGLILPNPADYERPFWESARDGHLRVQECTTCGHRHMPPLAMCPDCRSPTMEWVDVDRRGRIWSFVVAHPPLLPAYQDLAPFVVAVISLDEQPSLRLVGNIVQGPGGPIDEITPEEVHIGMAVEAVLGERPDGLPTPQWEPAG